MSVIGQGGDRAGGALRTSVGNLRPDTARLSNAFHAFFVETEEPSGHFGPEPDMSVELIDFDALCSLIVRGEFVLQSYIGLITLALLSPALVSVLPARLVPLHSGFDSLSVT
jgi:hypothetical protein